MQLASKRPTRRRNAFCAKAGRSHCETLERERLQRRVEDLSSEEMSEQQIQEALKASEHRIISEPELACWREPDSADSLWSGRRFRQPCGAADRSRFGGAAWPIPDRVRERGG
jgi:hypothetical protein